MCCLRVRRWGRERGKRGGASRATAKKNGQDRSRTDGHTQIRIFMRSAYSTTELHAHCAIKPQRNVYGPLRVTSPGYSQLLVEVVGPRLLSPSSPPSQAAACHIRSARLCLLSSEAQTPMRAALAARSPLHSPAESLSSLSSESTAPPAASLPHTACSRLRTRCAASSPSSSSA